MQRSVALIPWRSNITLLEKLSCPDLRLWYAQKTLELGLDKDMRFFLNRNKIIYTIMNDIV